MIEAGKISKLLKKNKIKTKELQQILKDKYNISLEINTLERYRVRSTNIPSATITALAEILNVQEQEFFIDSYWKKRKIAQEILNSNLIEIFFDNEIKESFFIDKKMIDKEYQNKELKATKNSDGSVTVYSPTPSNKAIIKILKLTLL